MQLTLPIPFVMCTFAVGGKPIYKRILWLAKKSRTNVLNSVLDFKHRILQPYGSSGCMEIELMENGAKIENANSNVLRT